MIPKAVLGFDLDGTLTKRNTEIILPDKLPLLLNGLDEFGYFSVPVTGKPSAYAQRIIQKNGLGQRGIIAENAGVYIKPHKTAPEIYGPNTDAIDELKRLIGIRPNARGVQNVTFNGTNNEIVVDPEDVSILTLFTNAQTVSHKWTFNPKMTTAEVYVALGKTIEKNQLSHKLKLLFPFPDGGIQIIRMKSNGTDAIDKSSIVDVISLIYKTGDKFPIAMFGDGHNDIPAMSPESVIPITFANSEGQVKEFVKNHHGYISKYAAPEGLGVIDGISWLLTQKDFFSTDSMKVSQTIHEVFPEL